MSKRPAETQSVSSCNTAASKYQLREGTSALFVLRVLYARLGHSLTRNEVRVSVFEQFNHPIKVWTFLKKLETSNMIVIEKGEGGERYILTQPGEQVMA